MRAAAGHPDALRRLASAHGIQLSYTAQGGQRVRTSTTGIRATLAALGVPARDPASVDASLADLGERRRREPLEPVGVVAANGMLSTQVVVSAAVDLTRVGLVVTREDGGVERRPLEALVVNRGLGHADGLVSVTLDLGSLQLPVGYHRLDLDGLPTSASALLLVAPTPTPHDERGFGVFAPVYALRGANDWGVGTFTELGQLADHVGSAGGELVGTLPMFPTFLDPPVDPSPYLPISRRFTSELFIDIATVPELAVSPAARDLLDSTALRRDLARLSQLPKVDYAAVMAHKRRALELCADALFASSGGRRDELDRYLGTHPELASYADFRAAGERLGTRWHAWGTAPGSLPADAGDESTSRYHRYAQFVAAEQLAAAAAGRGDRAGLYLDLPVGVHPEGFDTWSESASFAPATVGAPPDRLAPQGQAWGFPPLHPERIRADGYRYVISCYRHLLALSRTIRIDHVLGLQRLFWIPEGADATAGAYVRYRGDEQRAIVAIEAARAGAVVVGEDLGTVSTDIRQAMDRAGMLHIFIYQFDATAQEPFPQPTAPSMASFGNHDLARFAAFWRGLDIADRVDRGVTSATDAATEQEERRALVDAVAGRPVVGDVPDDEVARAFRRCVDALAAGPAPYVLIDLADVEGEVVPDNRPGTGPEADNWRWRLQRTLDHIVADPEIRDLLAGIAEHRQPANPLGATA